MPPPPQLPCKAAMHASIELTFTTGRLTTPAHPAKQPARGRIARRNGPPERSRAPRRTGCHPDGGLRRRRDAPCSSVRSSLGP
ncbi:hypothetical protein GCM10010302_31340 [Streptomyces polychromogenes]|uniref:Uncharacterized protein n=1 Tax=Streptomyces polychromogenes TaxID=67342 RepID=A0ABN0VE96_9ACTN